MFSEIYVSFHPNPYPGSFLSNNYVNWMEKIDTLTEIEVIGQVLYTHYVLQFLVAGIILLLAVIGAVVLVLNSSVRTHNVLPRQQQEHFRQLARTYKETLFKHKN